MAKVPLAFYITISCVAFVVSKIVIAVLLYRRWQRKHQVFQESMSGGKMVMFRSATMQYLTSDVFKKKTTRLTNKDIIGSGGYGTVYRLTIDDSTSFAVKRLNSGSADRDRGFERELEAMGDIKHRNIVTLHGYYTTPHYNLLIYDLMPNGSLDTVLHGRSNDKKPLDWPSRYKIALGAARGISYLHNDCIPHIIHRDIKSSNILLDQNMDARVSDFGLATLMEPDKTHVSTFVGGTFGYLAPGSELSNLNRIGALRVLYLYGFNFLPTLSPTLATVPIGSIPLLFLSVSPDPIVKTVVDKKSEEHAIDNSLGCYPLNEVKNVFIIAQMCLESDPSNRPNMEEVVKMLEQIKFNKNCTAF
ncbi:hypothetical protein IFM89_006112 [Coptis chinensis]|uniref:Protein kinase domain-containing protein n=1 Tax=Coptis chinensis TaxID=261450 RepID=A0A835LA82_9MAGN|nr:hypothetical protein IFM89_006112 [Coptis chinensis]